MCLRKHRLWLCHKNQYQFYLVHFSSICFYDLVLKTTRPLHKNNEGGFWIMGHKQLQVFTNLWCICIQYLGQHYLSIYKYNYQSVVNNSFSVFDGTQMWNLHGESCDFMFYNLNSLFLELLAMGPFVKSIAVYWVLSLEQQSSLLTGWSGCW